MLKVKNRKSLTVHDPRRFGRSLDFFLDESRLFHFLGTAGDRELSKRTVKCQRFKIYYTASQSWKHFNTYTLWQRQ